MINNTDILYVLATNNPGKAKEIKPLFEAVGLRLITLADLGARLSGFDGFDGFDGFNGLNELNEFKAGEDGDTFLDNATQKARETADFLNKQGLNENFAVLADDSGLEIDAMGGAPGVDSALFMGQDTPYPIRCQAILDNLAHVPIQNRTARFKCTLVCLMPDGAALVAEGSIEGHIAHEMAGGGGFGYDPIFFYPPHNKTLAQLTSHEKSKVSHRGRAIQKMIGLIIGENTRNQ